MHVVREWFEPVPELLEFIREESREVILFVAGDKEFPLEIIDHNGGRWVTRKQLAAALGAVDLKALHSRLTERYEIKENIHWSIISIPQVSQTGVVQNRETVIYSYRGIIRVSMASEGQNAVIFRDWAEDVLYKVMTTGAYGEPPLIKDLKSRVELLEKKMTEIIKPIHKTPALLEQKIHSMTIVQKYWYSRLTAGDEDFFGDCFGKWHSSDALYNDFLNFCDNIGFKSYRPMDAEFFKQLKQICKLVSKRKTVLDKRTHGYEIPELADNRDYFKNCLEMDIEWEYEIVE